MLRTLTALRDELDEFMRDQVRRALAPSCSCAMRLAREQAVTGEPAESGLLAILRSPGATRRRRSRAVEAATA